MDGRQKFNETSLSEKQDLYSHQNMEDIIDADYTHITVFKISFLKKTDEYNDLYVQSDTLLLFEYFQNMYFKIYELERAYFLSAP